MENSLGKKMKDKQIPEEELFEELDAMYRRVADIEKEEATEVSTQGETALFLEPSSIPAVPEKELKKKPGRKKKRDYRPAILATFAVLLVFILAITFWKPEAVFQFLRIGNTQQPIVASPSRLRKPPSAVTTSAPPPPPPVAASPVSSTAPPKSLPVQTKPEVAKGSQEEADKTRPINPQERYFAIQLGLFRNTENVRDLTAALKKEGLDVYSITMKNKKGENLYRVFVGQFKDKNEAARFLKDEKILRNYPDSFIQEISSSLTSP